MNIFGDVFMTFFGAVIPRPTAAPQQTMESLQHVQDVYSLANALRVTPDVAATIIAGRKLASSAILRGEEGEKVG